MKRRGLRRLHGFLRRHGHHAQRTAYYQLINNQSQSRKTLLNKCLRQNGSTLRELYNEVNTYLYMHGIVVPGSPFRMESVAFCKDSLATTPLAAPMLKATQL